MTRRRKLLIVITLAALVLLVGYLRSDSLSNEEQLFLGHWQAVPGSPIPFEGTFSTDRWMVTHHLGHAENYQWRCQEGRLIVTEAIVHPRNSTLGQRTMFLLDLMIAKLRGTPIAQDEILTMGYSFLPDGQLSIQSAPSTAFPEPFKLQLRRVPVAPSTVTSTETTP